MWLLPLVRWPSQTAAGPGDWIVPGVIVAVLTAIIVVLLVLDNRKSGVRTQTIERPGPDEHLRTHKAA